jgi:hypothetical protein
MTMTMELPAMMPCSVDQTTDQLLEERDRTHGNFERNAEISQRLKNLFRYYGAREMPDRQREALDMIALKLSRILGGQSNFRDHWKDVAGYSELAARACE